MAVVTSFVFLRCAITGASVSVSLGGWLLPALHRMKPSVFLRVQYLQLLHTLCHSL